MPEPAASVVKPPAMLPAAAAAWFPPLAAEMLLAGSVAPSVTVWTCMRSSRSPSAAPTWPPTPVPLAAPTKIRPRPASNGTNPVGHAVPSTKTTTPVGEASAVVPADSPTWHSSSPRHGKSASVSLLISSKASPLDEDEREEVKLHASVGASILERIPSLRHLSTGARYHHERWDGRGYPEGLRGDHIPLIAQVLAVSDSYDAMTSNRAYRPSRDHDVALEEIARGTGIQFGPRAAAAFLTLPDHLFQSIRRARAPLRVGAMERRTRRVFAGSSESHFLVG